MSRRVKRTSEGRQFCCPASGSRAHYYRVGYRPNRGQPNPLPQLTIKGRWLEALGFTTGQKIEVITGPGQLIIRLVGV
ncbi:Endoribonuclease SymE [Pantoea ananatis]|nr:Endoribonuclease SymE [Pantoea ananatis]